MQRDYLSFESQLRQSTTAGGNLRRFVQHSHSSQHFSRTDMQTHSRSRAHTARCVRQHIDPNVDDLRRSETCCRGQDHASLNLGLVDAAEIDGSALPGVRFCYRRAMNLQAAHSDLESTRQEFEILTLLDLS